MNKIKLTDDQVNALYMAGHDGECLGDAYESTLNTAIELGIVRPAAADAASGERHKPLNMPADRSKMIEKALNADDGLCSTGTFAESDEAEYWSLRAALATIAHENLNTIGLSDSEKVAAFKKIAADALVVRKGRG